MKFRKKPVVIEAWKFVTRDHPDFTPAATINWMQEALNNGMVNSFGGDDPHLVIKTLEGNMRGDLGDWIIQGVKGEIYPCKPDIFTATYEAVS